MFFLARASRRSVRELQIAEARRTVADSGIRIGFIGAGQMATALAKGFVQSGVVEAGRIVACDVSADAAMRFANIACGTVVASIRDIASSADIVFLAVKPQYMGGVLAELKPVVGPQHLIVSIAAGVSIQKLLDGLGTAIRMIRVMPNTPCLVGKGASAFARGGTASPQDGETVRELLSTIGVAIEVSEKLLDAVTGLSGSGPAYVYLVIEALSDGGVRAGLPRDIATRLAAQTVLGAAQMVLETGQHPGALKDAVTSPGGTTISGLHALERGGLRGILMDAVQAATERSQQLGQA